MDIFISFKENSNILHSRYYDFHVFDESINFKTFEIMDHKHYYKLVVTILIVSLEHEVATQ